MPSLFCSKEKMQALYKSGAFTIDEALEGLILQNLEAPEGLSLVGL